MLATTSLYKDPSMAARSPRSIATEILTTVMRYRRVASDSKACADVECSTCLSEHSDRVRAAIARNEPVIFVLPAFPGKSPNPAKVLGKRPDMAEQLSLAFLDKLCRKIQTIYAPGAKLVLCSDGRVFNDAIGIAESDITQYQHDLVELIEHIKASHLSTFNLDNVYSGCTFDEMRTRLMREFGTPIEVLQEQTRKDGDTLRLYRGMTRFLFEDALRPDMMISRTALQKESRKRAYQVIQRSKAWDGLLATIFPDAVRLSIHPQICGSRKIGIHLMATEDEWLTPWHGVAVEMNGRFKLMKRREAESLGATLVYRNERPSHYRTPEAQP